MDWTPFEAGKQAARAWLTLADDYAPEPEHHYHKSDVELIKLWNLGYDSEMCQVFGHDGNGAVE